MIVGKVVLRSTVEMLLDTGCRAMISLHNSAYRCYWDVTGCRMQGRFRLKHVRTQKNENHENLMLLTYHLILDRRCRGAKYDCW
jgi:hypothetical protein